MNDEQILLVGDSSQDEVTGRSEEIGITSEVGDEPNSAPFVPEHPPQSA